MRGSDAGIASGAVSDPARTIDAMNEEPGEPRPALRDALDTLPAGSFVIVEFVPADRHLDTPPYAQAAHDPLDWCIEVVSERYLSVECWPIDAAALELLGFAPHGDRGNWQSRAVETVEVVDRLVDGLVKGRCCMDDGVFQVSFGTFPSGPDGGIPVPDFGEQAA